MNQPGEYEDDGDRENIHVQVPSDLKQRLLAHYPGRGELTNLVRRALECILIQMESGAKVDLDTVAKAITKDDRTRGLKGGGSDE